MNIEEIPAVQVQAENVSKNILVTDLSADKVQSKFDHLRAFFLLKSFSTLLFQDLGIEM